jgi:hypothetical protein
MTEAEWLTATDPVPMLVSLRGRVSLRKLWLFGCGCCQSIWPDLTDERTRRAVDVAERFADGLAGSEELREGYLGAFDVSRTSLPQAPREHWFNRLLGRRTETANLQASRLLRRRVYVICRLIDQMLAPGPPGEDVLSEVRRVSVYAGMANNWQELNRQATLVRCVAGNPFLPVPCVEPAWRTWNDGTMGKLASDIYNSRDFNRLPLLADALEDAGCTDAELLGHLRGPGPHVRGCWALDLVLSKS